MVQQISIYSGLQSFVFNSQVCAKQPVPLTQGGVITVAVVLDWVVIVSGCRTDLNLQHVLPDYGPGGRFMYS